MFYLKCLLHIVNFLLQNEVNERSLSNKLRTTLKRIEDNLIIFPDESNGSSIDEQDSRDKIPHPHLSAIVKLDGLEKLYGLPERLIATESLLVVVEY